MSRLKIRKIAQGANIIVLDNCGRGCQSRGARAEKETDERRQAGRTAEGERDSGGTEGSVKVVGRHDPSIGSA